MSASPEHGGKCRAARGDRGKSAYTGQNHSFVSTHACPFRRLRRHLPRSRGRLFCESFPYFSILLILFSIFYLPTLTPFVSSADTLAKGKASHSLLQRRSAPRKAVRLLPDKRGQLAFPIFCLCTHLAVNILIKL